MATPGTPLSFRDVLRLRPVRRLWIAQIVSVFGDFLAVFAIIAVVTFQLHGTATQVAMVLVSFMAPLAIVSPLAGVFVDRWHLKRTMIASDLIRGVLVLLGLYAWSITLQSRSREFAIAAENTLDRDPQLSLWLAFYGVAASRCLICTVPVEAEDALHRAMHAAQLRGTLTGHGLGVSAAAFSSDGKLVATAGLDAREGQRLFRKVNSRAGRTG